MFVVGTIVFGALSWSLFIVGTIVFGALSWSLFIVGTIVFGALSWSLFVVGTIMFFFFFELVLVLWCGSWCPFLLRRREIIAKLKL